MNPEPDQQSIISDSVEREATKRCRYCGEEILAVATICKHCRRDLIRHSNHGGAGGQIAGGIFFVIFLGVVGIMGIVALINSGANRNPCQGSMADTYANAASDAMRQFTDEAATALSTPRIALSGPVARLQAIQRQAQNLNPPAGCPSARDMHAKMLHWMSSTVDAVLAFMRSDARAASDLQAATAETQGLTTAIDAFTAARKAK